MGSFTSFFFKTTTTIKLLISLISILLAYAIQEHNLTHLKSEGISLREQQTVKTADDISYLSPALSYYKTGRVYADEIQKYQSVTRSPGYGFINGVFLHTLGEDKALSGLKWLQLLLFGLSIFLFFGISSYFIKHTLLAYAVVALYALLPFSHGFIYYTLTEGITPSLTIIYFYILLKAHQKKSQKIYFWSALLLAFIIVVRPFLLLYTIPLIGLIYLDFRKERWQFIKTIMISLVISWVFMGAWQIRNYVVLDKFTGLHPIYQKEVPGVFRPVHAEVWNFYKGFEHQGDRFHQSIVPFWHRSLNGDTTMRAVSEHISSLPLAVTAHLSQEKLTTAFSAYQKVTHLQKEFIENEQLIPTWLFEKEEETAVLFQELTSDFKSAQPLKYHIITPSKVFVNLLFHSNLSLYIFQKTYRGQWWMELLRVISLMLYLGSFLLSFCALFLWKKSPELFLMGVTIFTAIFYLVYFQRGVEERYLLPFLPIAFVLAAALKNKAFFHLFRRRD
jgi:4-amino-4-deoxy-L-arabinose transferase-like glycosyltransferase